MNSPTAFAFLAAITVGMTTVLPGTALGQAPTIRTSKEVYAPGEPITVIFENFPAAGKGTDWLSLAQEDHPGNRYHKYVYLHGRTSGTHQFPAQAVGRYEIRGYFDWPSGGYNPQLCVPLVVASDVSSVSKPATTSGSCRVVGAARDSAPAVRAAPTPSSVPAAATAPVRQSQPPSSQEPVSDLVPRLPDPGLTGSWLGYVSCAAGQKRGAASPTIPAFLDIKESEGLTADLYVVETYAPAVRMTGSYDSQTHSMRLQAKEWIYPSRTVTEPPAITAILDDSGLRLQGEIALRPNLRQCTSFRAFKFARDQRPANANGLLAAFPDARGAHSLRDETLCKDFLTWNVEGSAIETQGEAIPSQLVDGDSFYRIMGKPYDQWTDPDERVFQGLLTGCRSAFQGSSSIEYTNLLAKEQTNRQLAMFLNPGAPDKPDEMRHYTYLKRYALVVALRNARLHAEFTVNDVRSLQATRENRDRLASTARSIEEGAGLFVALEKGEARRYAELLNRQEERIVGELGKIALAEAETEVGRIRAAADAPKQLAALKSIYLGESSYHDLLLPADRGTLESRLVDQQRAVSKRAIEPIMTELETTPADDAAALKKIEELAKALEPTLSLLVNGLDREYHSRIQQKREDTLTKLIAQRLALLETYPAGTSGLDQSARWPDDLYASFGTYESSGVFVNAMKRYRESRNQLLRDSFPEFEAAVRRKGAEIEKIHGQYLSWEGDARLSAAASYLFGLEADK